MTEVNCGTRALDAYTRLVGLFNAPRLVNVTNVDQIDQDDYKEIFTQLKDLFWYIKESVETHPMMLAYQDVERYHTNFVYADAEHACELAGMHGLHTYLKACQFYTFTNKSIICRWASLDHIMNWIVWQYCDWKKNPIYDTSFQNYAEDNFKMALDDGSSMTKKYTSFHINNNVLCAFSRSNIVPISIPFSKIVVIYP
jgi:hypothetical protein